MSDVPMPRDLSEEAVKRWLADLYNTTNGEGRKVTYHCDPVLEAQARAVRSLVEQKVREAVCAGDVTDVLDEDRADAIVARVMGKEAPK